MSIGIGSNPFSAILNSPALQALTQANPTVGAALQSVAQALDGFSGAGAASGAGALPTNLSAPPARLANTGVASGSGPTGQTRADMLNAASGSGGPGSTSNQGANDVMQFGGDLDQRQKDQIAFQQKMQRQTEAFTLISNILKMLHDATQQWAGNLK